MQRIVFVIDWLRTTTASVRAGRWRLLTHDKKLTISALLPMLTFASGSTLATEWHAISDIVSTTQKAVVATQPVGSDFDVQVQTPDPRLRLSACQQPLQARPTGSPGQLGAHVTVLVQCHDKKPWKIYVRATIGQYQPVLVATNHLSRNAVVNATDIKLERRRISDLHAGYLHSPDVAIGQTVRRTLTAGSIILPTDLRQQALVKRGQQVMLVTKDSGISIRMQGTVMTDAVKNGRVRVRNVSSGRIVEGTVIDAQTIEIR